MASFPRNRYVLASEEAVDRRRPSISSSSSTLLCYSSILRTPQTMLPKTLRNAVERSKPRTFLEAGVFFLTTIVRYYYCFFSMDFFYEFEAARFTNTAMEAIESRYVLS